MNCHYSKAEHCVISSVIASAVKAVLFRLLNLSSILTLRHQTYGLSVLQTHPPIPSVKFFPGGYKTFLHKTYISYKTPLRTRS